MVRRRWERLPGSARGPLPESRGPPPGARIPRTRHGGEAMAGTMFSIRQVRAGALEVAYEEHGLPGGPPVVLLHGFPYDPRAFDAMVPQLAAAGCRVVVPYLRGYGPTR